MSARTLLRECLWPRDGRSMREIDADVCEELQSHVERIVDEQVRAGVPADEARRRAAEQFGDAARYAAECRRIDLGERLLVRRAMAVVCVVLLAACGYLGWRTWQGEQRLRELRGELAATASRPAASGPSHDEWVNRLASLRDHMHTAFAVGPELTLLPPDEGLAIVRDAWPRIEIAEVKTGLLKAFAFSKALPQVHPRLLEVLDLGMTDGDPAIRAYAATYLQEHFPEGAAVPSRRNKSWRGPVHGNLQGTYR